MKKRKCARANTSDAQKAVYISAATAIDAILESGFISIYAIIIPAISSILISFVMLRGGFGKITAYIGLASGVLSIVNVVGVYFVSSLSFIIVIASTLSMVWFL